MSLRGWLRPPASRAIAQLSEDVRRLTSAVERLEAMQRKDAQQIKQLREAVIENGLGWRRSMEAAEASAEEFRRHAERQHDTERERQRTLARIDERLKSDAKWRKIFGNQISALIRHICLPLERLSPAAALSARRFRLRSQNEEDGVLFALLDRAGWGGCRFVEIGSGASGGNAAALALECGWSGLMIDALPQNVASARVRFAANPTVEVIAERITPANVNTVLASHGCSGEVDVLSIDIDSYDYWVLEALNGTPRILVLEYNALFGPERRVTVPLDQPLSSAPKGYAGASLSALADLAARKGYRLVTCENAGVNAFFLRRDVAPEVPGVSPAEAFKPLRSRVDLDDAEVDRDLYEIAGRLNLPLVDV